MQQVRQGASVDRPFRMVRARLLVAIIAASSAGTLAQAQQAGALPAVSASGTRFTAQDLSRAPGLVFAPSLPGRSSGQAADDGAKPAGGAEGAAPRSRFGEAGTVQFNIFGDYADDFDDAWMAGAQFGISWFFLDHLSLDLQLEQWGISQTGADAYAIGPAVLVRWHLLPMEHWSLYLDAGCGFFYGTRSVPATGSEFNFTPRAGVGASLAISERSRIMTGVRWFHISNANTSTPNPGRDSMEIYAGLSIPF